MSPRREDTPPTKDLPPALAEAYDPARFRDEGRRLVDRLADYLADVMGRRAGLPVLSWKTPAENLAAFPGDFPERPAEGGAAGGFEGLVGRVLERSIHLHHPRYVGHQVTAPLPVAALAELVGAMLNNGMAIYEMGPASTAMEKHVIRWLSDRLGFGAGAGGVLTSGGSIGNLTALLAARRARSGFDVWGEGHRAGPELAVIASEQSHYCVDRAARIMGWGKGGVAAVAVDERYRLRPEALPGALARAKAEGKRVIGVVAAAGSTATGAFDPLEPIADFCEKEGLWLHVDGAHGATAALSPRHRGLVQGIERADSVVWDAHKMMLMPALITAVIFRDEARGREVFAQEATYLFHGDREASFDTGEGTLECTKRMMSLELYAVLSVLGTQVLSDAVERTFELGRRFGEMLRAAGDFEIPVDPQANIVCFRHVPPGAVEGEALDELQDRLRIRLRDEG